ncbi:MAG TPA: hypothetical protein VNZ64_18255 [Candidatus Acidoferrum sp.]|nr:hypothetical protein [Candidatus Acidoferrum sp.]
MLPRHGGKKPKRQRTAALQNLAGARTTNDLRKEQKELSHTEAMICGLTLQERRNPHILNAKRRQRIARGRDVSVTELNTTLNKVAQMQQMMKKMGKSTNTMARMGGGAAGLLRK